MDEHNELRARLRAVGMELFRRDGLRFYDAAGRCDDAHQQKDDLRGLPIKGGAAAGYGGRCVHKDPRPQAAHP